MSSNRIAEDDDQMEESSQLEPLTSTQTLPVPNPPSSSQFQSIPPLPGTVIMPPMPPMLPKTSVPDQRHGDHGSGHEEQTVVSGVSGMESQSQITNTVNTVEESMAESPQVTLRDPSARPVYKLSVRLLDTYKYINKVYYEAKARKLREQKDSARGGVHNDGYDDQNYDYILVGDEIFNDRYILKHRMGKGSFGQVVCAYDQVTKQEVAIKIIKSRKPFLMQAKTEIEILNKILAKDPADERHIVRLLDQFIYRNHQCLVFEILSFNLYELLRNTKFRGVSLNLIRKFSIQLLRSLELLAHPDVDIIHCDLKPENILLKHPRRSAIKLIDFGSSCYSTKRTYTYIQSRFYRSPEVLLGLPYCQKIDMWSLGCVVVEMHTGEPLFGGANQVDQICRIVDIMGMPPLEMIKASPEKVRKQFFEVVKKGDEDTVPSICDLKCAVEDAEEGMVYVLKRPNRDLPKPRTLEDILGVTIGGPSRRRLGEPNHAEENYRDFLDFVQRLLIYQPNLRAAPSDLANHPYLNALELVLNGTPSNPSSSATTASATTTDHDGQSQSHQQSATQSRTHANPDAYDPTATKRSKSAGL